MLRHVMFLDEAEYPNKRYDDGNLTRQHAIKEMWNSLSLPLYIRGFVVVWFEARDSLFSLNEKFYRVWNMVLKVMIRNTEAATRDVLRKKMFLIISQNSQENTCARVRGGSRAAATCKMERLGNGWKPLTIITKRSILDVAAALDLPLRVSFLIKLYGVSLYSGTGFFLRILRIF